MAVFSLFAAGFDVDAAEFDKVLRNNAVSWQFTVNVVLLHGALVTREKPFSNGLAHTPV